jgi:hypothetical protein
VQLDCFKCTKCEQKGNWEVIQDGDQDITITCEECNSTEVIQLNDVVDFQEYDDLTHQYKNACDEIESYKAKYLKQLRRIKPAEFIYLLGENKQVVPIDINDIDRITIDREIDMVTIYVNSGYYYLHISKYPKKVKKLLFAIIGSI